MKISYASVTSGIEAATVAWHPLGWRPVFFSEIEPFPCRLLKYHYPEVPNLGDMLLITKHPIFNASTFDVLVGGTPCQSFSLAGLRAGLADERGNLALEYCRILRAKRPTWFVWENVPGVLSSFSDEAGGAPLAGVGPEHGRDITETADFATLLAAFRDCGYSVAYRVLDSQYFGVPQQRRRVFVVGHLGDDWRPPAAVLLEPHCLRGDPAPSKEAGEKPAATIAASAGRSGGAGHNPGHLTEIGATLTTSGQKLRVDDTFIVMSSAQVNASVMEDMSPTLMAESHSPPMVAGKWPAEKASTLNTKYADKQGLEDQHINSGAPLFVPHPPILYEQASLLEENWKERDVKNALAAHTSRSQHAVVSERNIRRMTPLEWERLQGFPDNYTKIPGAKDAPRYKALGNSMTRHVMHWIGRRIDIVHNLIHPQI